MAVIRYDVLFPNLMKVIFSTDDFGDNYGTEFYGNMTIVIPMCLVLKNNSHKYFTSTLEEVCVNFCSLPRLLFLVQTDHNSVLQYILSKKFSHFHFQIY